MHLLRIPLVPLALAAYMLAAAPGHALASTLQATPQAAALEPPPPQGTFAFVGVTVLPMQISGDAMAATEAVLPDRTVVVRDGVITAVGPADSVTVPADATRIDGAGRFLMPGLAEMHAHVPPVPRGSDAWPDREALDDILFLYVANGVTTIRGMLGSAYQLELRDQIERGETLGPTFFVGAPSLNGSTAPDPASAERLVRAHAAAGYDLQKIHPGLSRPTWDRMAEVAHEVGLTFGGHVPSAVGLEHALQTGISTVDHLDGYVDAVASADVRTRRAAGESVGLGDVVASAAPARIREVARMTRAAGTWVVPTMYLWENLNSNSDADSILALPEMRYVSPSQREAWRRQAARRGERDPAVVAAHLALRRDILGVLSEEGVGILMGTDSPQLFNVPGFALHRELRVMRESGMSNAAVLASGTVNVGRYAAEELGEDGAFGSVAPGHRADLVLLEANPLDDLGHLERRAGVMVRGRWLPASMIEERLEAIARKHGG